MKPKQKKEKGSFIQWLMGWALILYLAWGYWGWAHNH